MDFLSKLIPLFFFLGFSIALNYSSEEYNSEEYEYSEVYENYINNLIEESEKENGTERAIGSFTTGNYYKEFVEGSKLLLKTYNLWDKRMVMDQKLGPSRETIKWSQWNRCYFSYCSEGYTWYTYHQDGDRNNPPMKVFVADAIEAPLEFYTTGGSPNADEARAIKDKLFFGFLYYGGQGQAFFFVIHPKEWRPYQKRFKTNRMTEFFNTGIASGVGGAIGAAMGSILPGPGTIAGGAAGAVVGAVFSNQAENYFGDYLRYIG